MTSPSKTPLFSVVIIAYNMAREVPRTVQSFLPPYQSAIDPKDIEIIVVENGSLEPIAESIIAQWPDNVRYIHIKDASPSPAKALNLGVSSSRGRWVCPVIDGARMVSPGLLEAAAKIIKLYNNPVIATLGYHLGHRLQPENVRRGYDQTVEDRLLANINWPSDPYRLFEISCLAGSSQKGWMAPLAECNTPILNRKLYEDIGGFDEAFDIPGGGIVNHDFFKRIIDHADTDYILLLGEGSFHQFHGGVTTSQSVGTPSETDEQRSVWDLYIEQYEAIRGVGYEPPSKTPILFGPATFYVKKHTRNFVLKDLALP